MRGTGTFCTLVLAAACGLAPQVSAQGLPIPPTWRWVTDAPATVTSTQQLPEGGFRFVQMAPGWHVTMGPGGLLFEPRYFLEGNYLLESEIFLFPDSLNGEYGFFVAGKDLDGAAPAYVVFAVRGDGAVAAWQHAGGTSRMLSDWRPADAVRQGSSTAVVRNVLRLAVSRKEAVFKANGLDVLILPLEGLVLDGQFGFRVGRAVNLHASTLNATSRLAPVRE